MKQSEQKHTSIFLSLVLRHQPSAAGILLDRHGWANIDELIEGVNRTGRYFLDRRTLEEIVANDAKQRYSISADGTKIRANQGHSVKVDVDLTETEPPEYLYHGTAERFCESIRTEGLKSKTRLYVHLSKDKHTATAVGKRHGKPVVLTVSSGKMYRDGYKFYLSVNDVWLTKYVPVGYIDYETEVSAK